MNRKCSSTNTFPLGPLIVKINSSGRSVSDGLKPSVLLQTIWQFPAVQNKCREVLCNFTVKSNHFNKNNESKRKFLKKQNYSSKYQKF